MTICDLVIGDIQARAALGIKRYGKPLAVPRGVSGACVALQNAYEECLDQSIYLRQAIEALHGEGTKTPQDESKTAGSGLARAEKDDLTCAKCGSLRANLRSKAQHERRCKAGKVLEKEEGGGHAGPACSICRKIFKYAGAVKNHEARCGKDREAKKYIPPAGSYERSPSAEEQAVIEEIRTGAGAGKLEDEDLIHSGLPEVTTIPRPTS